MQVDGLNYMSTFIVPEGRKTNCVYIRLFVEDNFRSTTDSDIATKI